MLATRAPLTVDLPLDPNTIVVTDLLKRYKGAELNAVDGISFNVKAGELFALLGPNGAGKTTTISILTTTLAPTSGSAIIGGPHLPTPPNPLPPPLPLLFPTPHLH